jgi:hypothetical protein
VVDDGAKGKGEKEDDFIDVKLLPMLQRQRLFQMLKFGNAYQQSRRASLVYNKKFLLKPNVRPHVAIGETEPM